MHLLTKYGHKKGQQEAVKASVEKALTPGIMTSGNQAFLAIFWQRLPLPQQRKSSSFWDPGNHFLLLLNKYKCLFPIFIQKMKYYICEPNLSYIRKCSYSRPKKTNKEKKDNKPQLGHSLG